MARTVEEVMNRELFTVRADERIELTRDTTLALGIGAVPVIDDDRRPIGVVTLRDLVASSRQGRHVRSPALTVSTTATLDEAGRLLGESDHHHLVVVGPDGRIAGMASAMDILRGLLGVPARHPATFPHYDRKNGVTWSDDTPLAAGHVEAAPVGAGVLVLVHGGPGMRETPVWVEAAEDVRGRLEHMIAWPESQPERLAKILRRTHLRFRAAEVDDGAKRAAIVERVTADLAP
jgi:CBS domain-containing protein